MALNGQINEASGVLTGVISSAALVGGQVVGMRGLKGDKGNTGDTGADGYSPSASVAKAGSSATITITDKNGTTTASVTDGQDGQDGFSPSASVSKVDNVATITITDKDGTTTANVYDGINSVMDVTVDDVSVVDQDGVAILETATQLRDGLMSSLDWQKLDGIASGAEVNVQSDWNQSTNTADDYIKNKPTIPSKTSDLLNDSGFITGMTILSYGTSTWNDFINAYNANKVVYCRASSNSNPATGAQNRLAFMAYVNSSTPTEVEFQYYRSAATHSASQQGDQVFVYKLNSSGTWSVTTREASSKIVAGTNMSSSYSDGTLTLNHEDSGVTAGTYDGGDSKGTGFYIPSFTVDSKGHITSATDLGTLIPETGGTGASLEKGHLVYGYDWEYVVRTSSISQNAYRISAGNTSATFTLTDPACFSGDSYRFQILGVTAIDSSGNSVIVDWSVDYAMGTAGKSNIITLTVNLAEAYDKDIIIKPIVAYANTIM